MPFFLPSRLIDLEYLSGEVDPEYERISRPYADDIQFAFFAVNLGYSRSEFDSLTPKEIIFIQKAWEDRIVRESSYINMAVENAVGNAFRKKSQQARALWKKRKQKVADKEGFKSQIALVERMEKKQGKSWVEKIHGGRSRKGGA